MSSSGGFKPSALPPITETGMKGFFKWFQREQPEAYKSVLAPQVSSRYPQVFSDYNQSVTQHIRGLAGEASLIRRLRVRGGMGQITNIADSGLGYGQNPDFTVNTTSMTGAGSDVPNIEMLNTLPAIDTADAANTGAGTPTATTSGISSIISGITGLFTAYNTQQTAKAITNLQLQRAQQGLAPLNIGMNANGIPTITAGLMSGGSGTLLLLGLAAVAALMLFGGMRSRKAQA